MLLRLSSVATALRQMCFTILHIHAWPIKKTQAAKVWRLGEKNVQKPVLSVYFITTIMIQHLFLLVCDQPVLRWRWGSGWTDRPRDEPQIALRCWHAAKPILSCPFRSLSRAPITKGKSQRLWVT